MARIAVEHLTKIFPGPGGKLIRAVDDASFTVEDKELVVLVGPSGCGKTTTLRLIAGLEEPDAGVISMDGKVVSGVAPKDRDVAMVFQHHALYPHLTARENLAFGLRLRKIAKAEIERRVNEAEEMLGLRDCLGRLPHELSGGERQRVALGRALVRRPKALLLDEPLSNLDGPMRHQLRREIASLQARLGLTMIYVTHDQTEAMTIGHRIVVLRAGAAQQVADPIELYRQPANIFVAGFVGSPPMNLFRGHVLEKEGGLFFAAGAGDENPKDLCVRIPDATAIGLRGYIGKEIILGIRAEDIASSAGQGGAMREQTLEAQVEGVETTGAESYARTSCAAGSFVVRLPATTPVRAQERMQCIFQMERARFFDAVTERRINVCSDGNVS